MTTEPQHIPDTEIDELDETLYDFAGKAIELSHDGYEGNCVAPFIEEAKQAISTHYARREAEVELRARIDELDNVQILYEGGHDFVGYIEDELEKLKRQIAQLTPQAEQERKEDETIRTTTREQASSTYKRWQRP